MLSSVANSEKRRFALSDDGALIRANQGHSVDVDLGLEAASAPAVLYHGTVERFLGSIRATGLRSGERHAVHLSTSHGGAAAVSRRRGHPMVLEIDAARMTKEGFTFYLSRNDVWLTDHVPPDYITFPTS